MKTPGLLLILLTGLASVASAGCARQDKVNSAGPANVPANATTHTLQGEIITVTPARSAVLVHHEEIPGYMPPMTMEFQVTPADLARLKEGDQIRARLTQDDHGTLRLEAIEVIDPVKERAVAAAANALRQETTMRGKGAYRELGETVPQFTLYNQDGDVVSINRFRGKKVVLNFIYTRCPIANMCPLSTQNMMALQRAAREKGVTGLELVSISLDPAYDTPPVLKEYSRVRGIDNTNFSFLTGPEKAVRDLLAQFGVIVEPGDSFLKHTLSTILIDEQGRIIFRVDGSQWSPADFLNHL
jgi:protein SCO1/2